MLCVIPLARYHMVDSEEFRRWVDGVPGTGAICAPGEESGTISVVRNSSVMRRLESVPLSDRSGTQDRRRSCASLKAVSYPQGTLSFPPEEKPFRALVRTSDPVDTCEAFGCPGRMRRSRFFCEPDVYCPDMERSGPRLGVGGQSPYAS